MKVTAGMVARGWAPAEPRRSPDGRWLASLESFDGRGDVVVVSGEGDPPRRRGEPRTLSYNDRVVTSGGEAL